VWHYHGAATPSCPKRSQKPSGPTYAFHGKDAWRPPGNVTPLNFQSAKSLVSELFSEVCLFLCYQWFFQNIEKDWRKFFKIRLIPQFLKMTKIKNIFSPVFFNILKEPLVLQKQTIPQKKALIFSLLQLEQLRVWHYQKGTTPPCPKSIFC
jgi:hypothetical protein